MADGKPDGSPRRLIEAAAFQAANSRTYLLDVFEAYRSERVVAVLPRMPRVRSIPGVKIVERRAFEEDPGWIEIEAEPIVSDAPAQISFTSGTTGRPKPILLSHRALADVTTRINAAMKLTPRVSEYIGVPVTYSFGFGRVRAVAAVGGRAFLPAQGFDPAEISRMLAAGEINAVSAVPTLWRVLLADPKAIGFAARRRLKWIEIGSQYMARSEKEALKKLFPNARILQHYGLTEASRATLLDISETEGTALESVGRPTGTAEVSISGDGLVCVRGPHVANGIVTGAGIKPITDADGWLTTADRGRLEAGDLYFEGRADELINCGGLKVDPARFEQRLTGRLGTGVAVGRFADPLRGERILVAAEAAANIDAAALRREAEAVAAEDGLTSGALVYRTLETVPRTATGKVRRQALSEMAKAAPATGSATTAAATEAGAPESTLAPTAPATDPGHERAEALRSVWAKALGIDEVPLDQSFYDLGGDSLSALTVSLRMESLGLDATTARGLFEGRTIAELAGLLPDSAIEASVPTPASVPADPPSPPRAAPEKATPAHLPRAAVYVWSINALRGLAALLVVFVHWSPGVIERMLPAAQAETLLATLVPFFRFGTPCFAFMFGLGVGYFLLKGGRAAKLEAIRRNRITGLILVGGSLTLIAASHLGQRAIAGAPIASLDVANAFYNVLAYYLLAFLTLPLWVRALGRPGLGLLTVLLAGLAFWLLGIAVKELLPGRQIDGLLEWPKLMAIAKYNYFRMTAIAFGGIALGIWLSRQEDPRRAATQLMLIGALSALWSTVVISEAYPGGAWPAETDGRLGDLIFMTLYCGVAVLAIGAGIRLFAVWSELSTASTVILRLLVVAGVLALPIYALHQVVRPVRDILADLGVPGVLAMGLPMGAFLTGIALSGLHIYRLYFGAPRPAMPAQA